MIQIPQQKDFIFGTYKHTINGKYVHFGMRLTINNQISKVFSDVKKITPEIKKEIYDFFVKTYLMGYSIPVKKTSL